MASTTMTSDLGYKTVMDLSASLTGKTQGNTREVHAQVQINFVDSGYGSYAYAPVTYVLQINDVTVDSWSPTSVNKTSYSLSGNLYVNAGQTINVKAYAYVSWSGANFNYPPNPNNGGSSVSVAMVLESVKSVISEVNDFVLENAFSVGITSYDDSFEHKLDIKIGENLIKSISNYKSNNEISLNTDEILLSYKNIPTSSAECKFILSTLNGTSTVGTDEKTATASIRGNAKIKVGGEWKRGLVWVKSGNVWKRGVIMIKQGTWKRGI